MCIGQVALHLVMLENPQPFPGYSGWSAERALRIS